MLPTVTPPEKNMHGSQERTYRKSGDVYLRGGNKQILKNYSEVNHNLHKLEKDKCDDATYCWEEQVHLHLEHQDCDRWIDL